MRRQVIVAAGERGFEQHLLDGWHAAEDWCTWSAATVARLLVPLRPAPDDSGLEVRVTLVAAPSGGAYNGLRLLANGVELQPCAPEPNGAFGFSAHVADGHPWLLIEFHIDRLETPAAMGLSPDERALGIGLRRVEIDLDSPEAAAAGDATELRTFEWLPAADLLQPARLDLVVKARFFSALMTGRGLQPAREAYMRHIGLRTGGREPVDFLGNPSTKLELEHYELACRSLLMSMRRDGFDPRQAVPLGRADLPLNGAHRIACALALNRPVAVTREPREAGTWDMAWFEAHAYAKRDRLRLLFDLARFAPDRCSVFVLWPHAVDVWEGVVGQIGAEGYTVAGWVDLAWPEAQRPAYESLVFDMYSHGIVDFVQGFGHIDRKLGFLRSKPCFLRVGICMVNAESEATWDGITALKATIRQAHSARASVDQFVTCHFGDTIAESQHLARTLLVPENLDAVFGRRTGQPRPQFLAWLNDYAATLKQLGIDAQDCCIVGSASLEVQGIRLATDIDFTVREAIRSARFTPGVTRFGSGIDLVSRGYHRSNDGPSHPDDELIDEAGLHVYFRGFKIAAPRLVRDRKTHSRRPKDLLDVELMWAVSFAPFAAGV